MGKTPEGQTDKSEKDAEKILKQYKKDILDAPLPQQVEELARTGEKNSSPKPR